MAVKRNRILIRTGALLFIAFPLLYFGYFVYIGMVWGTADRLILLFVSDGLFLLFLAVGFGLWKYKAWSWWLGVILFTQFFIAKIISLFVNFLLVQTENIDGQFNLEQVAVEVIYLLFFMTVLILFRWKPVKDLLEVTFNWRKHLWRIAVSAILLYMLHLLLMILILTVVPA